MRAPATAGPPRAGGDFLTRKCTLTRTRVCTHAPTGTALGRKLWGLRARGGSHSQPWVRRLSALRASRRCPIREGCEVEIAANIWFGVS